MNKKSVVGLLTAAMFVPAVSVASDLYGALGYGYLDSEDSTMGNIGLSVGNQVDKNLSIEGVYTFTINKDDLGGGDSLSANSIGMFAVFQTRGNTYFKARAGYSNVDFDLEVSNITVTDNANGFAFGIGFGMKAGKDALEFEYTKLPDLDTFIGIPANASNSYFGISYKLGL